MIFWEFYSLIQAIEDPRKRLRFMKALQNNELYARPVYSPFQLKGKKMKEAFYKIIGPEERRRFWLSTKDEIYNVLIPKKCISGFINAMWTIHPKYNPGEEMDDLEPTATVEELPETEKINSMSTPEPSATP